MSLPNNSGIDMLTLDVNARRLTLAERIILKNWGKNCKLPNSLYRTATHNCARRRKSLVFNRRISFGDAPGLVAAMSAVNR
jgi:hypothetical protein